REQVELERSEDPAEEVTEDRFLKELYLFMKKRDTPIERIPHLGFKNNIYIAVLQVTAQQMWKQVYNRLGGNPRSTSAATCTRRHYEKLLLPYECHLKGRSIDALPQHPPKHFLYANYGKDDDDGQRPAKRSLFQPPLHYRHYYHRDHKILPPYVQFSPVLTSPRLPAPEPYFAFHPPHLSPTDRVSEPLEHLRHLAEKYKSSSGLTEPLNLSVKALSQETHRNPVSSFSPPSSSKTPKFLNKPFPLYTSNHPEAARNEGREAQDDKADVGTSSFSYPEKVREAYVTDVKTTAASGSPTPRADEGPAARAQKPSSPKTDFTNWPREDRAGLNISHSPPGLPRDNQGKMEIQIPLSVLHSWLRLYGAPAMLHRAKQQHITDEEEPSRQRDADAHFAGQLIHSSPAAEDLRLRPRSRPSPPRTTETSGNPHNTGQDHFTSYKSLTSGDRDQQDFIRNYSCKPSNCWDGHNKESHVSHIPVKNDSIPGALQQDATAANSYDEDASRGGKEQSEPGPPTVLMLNSASTSLLQLTTEEVMKLKKIISSSF
uniref:AT-rich interaction domain 6 n=1 Tax=Echeneis naucrates TaxID=173247 RepID=A0A665V8I7_ECHNA